MNVSISIGDIWNPNDLDTNHRTTTSNIFGNAKNTDFTGASTKELEGLK